MDQSSSSVRPRPPPPSVRDDAPKFQGGNDAGTTFMRGDTTTVYSVKVGHATATFDAANYDGNLAAAEAAAREWRRNESLAQGLTTNRFKLVEPDADGNFKYALVLLTQERVTLVDRDVLEKLDGRCMCVTRGGSPHAKAYVMVCLGDIQRQLHNVIMHGLPADGEGEAIPDVADPDTYICEGADVVDHINGYPMDNRRCNLRAATHSENNRNRSMARSATYEPQPDGQWVARLELAVGGPIIVKHQDEAACKAWVRKQCHALVNHNTEERQELMRSFEAIMDAHAEDFDWQDVDLTARARNEASRRPRLEAAAAAANRITLERKAVYDRFVAVDPGWTTPDELLAERKIRHLVDGVGGVEHKYCSACTAWRPVSTFGQGAARSDGLALYCKACVRDDPDKKRRTEDWKARNPDAVKRQNAESYARVREQREAARPGKEAAVRSFAEAFLAERCVQEPAARWVGPDMDALLASLIPADAAFKKVDVVAALRDQFGIAKRPSTVRGPGGERRSVQTYFGVRARPAAE